MSTGNTAKLVKRRAPSPTNDRTPSPDIAIARPIPMKMDQKGMIPPPPPPTNKSHSRAPSPELTNSSEHLFKSSPEPLFDANKAAASPPLLRASRKVAEVTTIKRQPKTGWL